MQPLTPITATAEEVFLACISKIKKAVLKQKLTAIKGDIVNFDVAYVAAGKKPPGTPVSFFSLSAHRKVGAVTKKEMERVYDGRMVGGPGRKYYDEILDLCDDDICPLCGLRLVETLDHYLPKSRYPALAVAPNNLLPACYPCNIKKRTAVPKCVSKQCIHPYYDNIDAEVWLTASIEKPQTPVVVLFDVAPPASWDTVTKKRVKHHFKELALGRLYSIVAGGDIVGNKHEFTRLRNTAAGAAAVKKYLLEQEATRRAARRNSWQAALYKALATDAWFCDTGCLG